MKSKTKRYHPLLVGVLVFVCNTSCAQRIVANIKDTNEQPARLMLANGKTYLIDFWNAPGEPREMPEIALQNDCRVHNFTGTDRKAAKTAAENSTPFLACGSLNDFKLKLYLPSAASMKTQLTKTSKSLAIEKHGVSLNYVYLFAFKRESDNNYHLKGGYKPKWDQAVLMNMEISGLPSPDDRSLADVRASCVKA